MILLLDIGNTHTHVGSLRGATRQVRPWGEFSTRLWNTSSPLRALARLVPLENIQGICLCSVVPQATRQARRALRQWQKHLLVVTHTNAIPLGFHYPQPASVGPDRLANAVAAVQLFGAPCVVVDFGTAVTFDVIDHLGRYAGGIIAPGLASMTDYLHEKTALLPKIQIRETKAVIGKNTVQAMRIGAVRGYRGMIKELLQALRQELRSPKLPVIATGGYAALMARRLPGITRIDPAITLRGLAFIWDAHHPNLPQKRRRGA